MHDDMKQFTASCPQCQMAQRRTYRRQEPHSQVDLDARPFQKWAIDFVGPLPETFDGKKWILTAIDAATGWPLARATSDATSETVADFLHDIYCNYGAFKQLLSDNGTNLTSKIIEEYLKRIKVKHQTTSAYHPQTNGKVERFNGMLGSVLTKLLIDRPIAEWAEHLPIALFACRVRNHNFTGMSPFKLLYGMEPRLTGDTHDWDHDDLDKDLGHRLESMLTARSIANRKLFERGIKARKLRADKFPKQNADLEPGDFVLVANEHREKFQPTYFGPFRVEKRLFFGTYILSAHIRGESYPRALSKPVNGTRLKLYKHADPSNVRTIMTERWKDLTDAKGEVMAPTPEILEEIERVEQPPDFSRRSILERLGTKGADLERSGDRSVKVGEGPRFKYQDTLTGATMFVQRNRKAKDNEKPGTNGQKSADLLGPLPVGMLGAPNQEKVVWTPPQLTHNTPDDVPKAAHAPEMPAPTPQRMMEGMNWEPKGAVGINSQPPNTEPLIGSEMTHHMPLAPSVEPTNDIVGDVQRPASPATEAMEVIDSGSRSWDPENEADSVMEQASNEEMEDADDPDTIIVKQSIPRPARAAQPTKGKVRKQIAASAKAMRTAGLVPERERRDTGRSLRRNPQLAYKVRDNAKR